MKSVSTTRISENGQFLLEISVSKFLARKYRNSVTDFWSHLEQSKILHFLSKSLTSKESFLSNCQKLNKNLRVNQNPSNFYVILEQNLEMVTKKPKFGSKIISDHFMVSNMNIMQNQNFKFLWNFMNFWRILTLWHFINLFFVTNKIQPFQEFLRLGIFYWTIF